MLEGQRPQRAGAGEGSPRERRRAWPHGRAPVPGVRGLAEGRWRACAETSAGSNPPGRPGRGGPCSSSPWRRPSRAAATRSGLPRSSSRTLSGFPDRQHQRHRSRPVASCPRYIEALEVVAYIDAAGTARLRPGTMRMAVTRDHLQPRGSALPGVPIAVTQAQQLAEAQAALRQGGEYEPVAQRTDPGPSRGVEVGAVVHDRGHLTRGEQWCWLAGTPAYPHGQLTLSATASMLQGRQVAAGRYRRAARYKRSATATPWTSAW